VLYAVLSKLARDEDTGAKPGRWGLAVIFED
jgi:hypothetical protein